MERVALLKLGGFTVLLALVFAGAALAGSAIDPDVEETEPAHAPDNAMDSVMGTHVEERSASPTGHEAHSETTGDTADLPGLAVAQGGYRLDPGSSRVVPRRVTPYTFQILGPDEEPVTEFDTTHERKLHLIAVRRDLGTFQHLHPRMARDGTWRAPLDTSRPGAYRVFADFSVDGTPMTLGTDLLVPGRSSARLIPAPRNKARTSGNYDVELTRTGQDLTFDVTNNGQQVNLRPYLGADGHLVALREHDLAFLHTHPEGRPGGTGPIEFETSFPSPGRYRLFLQFDVHGTVRTAAFTVNVTDADIAQAEEARDGGH